MNVFTEAELAQIEQVQKLLCRACLRGGLPYTMAVALEVGEAGLCDVLDANAGRYGKWVDEVTMDGDVRP